MITADWYFTRCLDTEHEPERAAALLGILECIDNTDTGLTTQRLAIEGLMRLDSWMQTYALSRVLRLARRATPLVVEVCDRYFEGLVREVSEHGPLLDLLRASASEDPRELVRTFRTAIQRSRYTAHQPTDIPYLDARDFLPENVILAAVACAAENSPRLAEDLRDDTSLALLVQQAVNGELGRLAFILGTRFSLICGYDSLEELGRRVKQHPGFLMQPDLVELWIWLHFVGTPNPSAEPLLKESIELGFFHRFAPTKPPRNQAKAAYFHPLPTNLAVSRWRPVEVIFWQFSLWTTAAEMDAEATAVFLGKLWRFPRRSGPTIAIGHPGPKSRAQTWRDTLQESAGLRRDRFTFAVREEQAIRLGDAAWIVASPFVEIDVDQLTTFDTRRRRYPTTTDWVTMLRLLLGTSLAARLLPRIEGTDFRPFAALLVEAHDVLGSFELRNATTIGKRQLIAPALRALALFAQQEIKEATSCNHDDVSPQLFLELFECGSESSDEEEIFCASILPSVLMSFVADVFASAIRGNGEARWLEVIPMIAPALSKQDDYHRRESQQVLRFLGDPSYTSPTDWRNNPKHNWNYVQYRDLLPDRDPRPIDLYHPDWIDLNEETNKSYRPLKLTLAVQRFVASFREPEGIPIDVLAQWRRQLIEDITALNHEREFDRFLRLRLIELLLDPSLDMTLDERRTLAGVLLEFGSSFHVQRLLDDLFPNAGLPPSNAPLCTELLPLIAREAYSGMRSDTAIRDPRDSRRRLERRRVFQDALGRISALAASNPAYAEVGRQLARISAEADIATTSVVQRVTLDYDGTDPAEWPDTADHPAAAREVVSISRDPNRMTITILFTDYETRGAASLFDATLSERDDLLQKERLELVGLVVAVERDDAFHIVVLNCGLASYLRYSSRNRPPFSAGARVYAVLARNGDAWTIAEPPMPLARKRTGRFVEAQLELDVMQSARRIAVRIDNQWLPDETEQRGPNGFFDRRYWVPLIRDSFRADRKAVFRTIAEHLETGEWRPVARELWQLAARGRAEVALTLVDIRADEETLIVSSAPATMYKLRYDDVSGRDRERLMTMLDEWTDPRGVQIYGTICADAYDQHLKIRLAENAFDSRDIEWRQQFADGENRVAVRRGAQQYWHDVAEPIEGYPQRITVVLFPPAVVRDDEIEFSPTGRWDPWRATITGNLILFNELSVPSEKRSAFMDEWTRLSMGKRLTIRRPIASVSPYGDVLCTTTDGTTVSVPAESLTMGSIERVGRRDLNRRAEVTRVIDQEPLHFEVDSTWLPDEVRYSKRAAGVIARTPRLKDIRSSSQVSLVIWWQGGSAILEREISFPVENARKLHLGSLVEAEPGDDVDIWNLRVIPRNIKARGLWRIEAETQVPPKDSLYLGVMSVNQKQQAFVEGLPGVLVPLFFAPNAKHMAEYDGARYVGGFSTADRVKVDSPSGTRTARLQVLLPSQSADRNIVWGDTSREYHGDATVAVQLRILERPDAWFVVERHFNATVKHAPAVQRSRESEELNEKDRQELERYFERPDRRLAVSVLTPQLVRLRNLRVPQHSSSNRWTSDVPVHKDHGLYLEGGEYSRDNARVVLFRDEDSRVFASFRLVAPLDVASFIQAEFGDSNPENQPLRNRLYYAGPEGTRHRFEWEYGASMLADEADLRVDGKPFSSVESVLFIGDAVTHASVILESERRILSFNSLMIRYSESTHLYLQRKKRIVHVLKLTPEGQHGVRITTVIGFAEHSTADSHPFTRSRTTLTASAQQIALARFAEAGEAAAEGLTMFGRFDDETFRQTLGRVASFDHVEATIDPVVGLSGDELVFLNATRLRTDMRNDCGVIVSPVGLDERDIGNDLRELTILRRNFSVREEVLSRIADTDATMIENRLYLVRLGVEQQSPDMSRKGRTEKRVTGTLWGNMPFRSASALKTLLAKGFVLATVLNEPSKKTRDLHVEYSPGIFLRVPRAEMFFGDPELEDELTRGTVVRLEASEGRIRVTRGAFSETRYVLPGDVRPVVILPKNQFADRRRDEWQRGDGSWFAVRFPLGGLPNVQATPGRYDARSGRWYPPSVEDFRALMQRPHPKLAIAGVDQKGEIRIAPDIQEVPVGSIQWDDITREPRYVPHPSVGGAEQPLEWSALSFADVSAQDVARRVRNEKWRYHDATTPTWFGRDGVRETELRLHDGTTGPLFFDRFDESLTLRFAAEAIQRFGFSVRELITSLEAGTTEYVVALATTTSLWVEVAPGRVAEMPFSQMVTTSARGLLSLERMHWDVFAPGDHVRLRLATSDPKVADKVVLEDWWPGVRGSFPQSAILPVLHQDSERGAVEIGAGEFRLLFPRIAPETRPTVRLTRHNRLANLDPARIRDGVGALLIVEEGKLRIAGLDGVAVPATVSSHWADDPLAEVFAGTWRDMKALVLAAGGAIPVTIEAIKNDYVIFSRRHQKAASVLPPGTMGRCRVLGLLDADSMLLRHGSGLLKASAHFVISGLPRSLFSAAAALLHDRQVPIWIRRPDDGREYEFGFAEEGHAVEAEVIDVLSTDHHDHTVSGLVCRSLATHALYWLPIEACAWTRLTPLEARAVFVANQDRKTISATIRRDRLNSRVLTMTGTDEALAELRMLDVDQEIAVRVVAPRTAGATGTPQHYLVETLTSNRMLLDCRVEEPLNDAKKTIRVEITRRVIGRLTFVQATPVDTRRYSVDLPAWMTTDEMNVTTPRFSYTLQERWLDSPRLLVSPSDDQLDQALCQLWAALEEKIPVNAEEAGVLVERWAARSVKRDEIELHHALMCFVSMCELIPARRKMVRKDVDLAIVRDFVQVWSHRASSLLRHIGRRAVRSLHVEVLSTHWIKRNEPEPPRLAQMRALMRASLKSTDVAIIRQFARYAELGGAMVLGWNLQLISDGLRRAIGEAEVRDSFHERASILNRLALLAATIPDVPNLRLPPDRAHVSAIREILDIVTGRRLDITLMAPIAVVDHIDGEAI